MASLTSFPNAINDAQIEPQRMQWLLNVPTRTKLMLSFGLVLLFLLAVIVAAYFGITTLNNRFHQLLTNEYALSLDLRSFQIRAILNDIQKATSSAVMAAEQGGRTVEAGARQSTDTSEAIRQLAAVIIEAAQAATQIAASSQQQLVGMSQVAQAMENINQAGSQNAASTRQAETIARDLHGLGQRLKQLVEQYQL